MLMHLTEAYNSMCVLVDLFVRKLNSLNGFYRQEIEKQKHSAESGRFISMGGKV